MKLIDKYGPWAIVTGASSGIGEQFAISLARRGFNLVLVARSEKKLLSMTTELEQLYGISVKPLVVDLSNGNAVTTITGAVEGLDVGLLINNAGFGYKGKFDMQPLDQIEAMIQVNSLAPLALTYALLEELRARQKSGIIFTGSIEGEAAFPHSTVYSATKAFVHHMGGGLWFEEKGNGVDVLTLAPGPTDTNAAVVQGIDREQKVPPMNPEKVSEMALAALGKKPLLIPGLSNRLIVRFFRFMPRAKALSLAGKGMVKALTDARGSY